ncbi:MAG TPA: hypothetical protein VG318_09790 [Actinomycetota bacterium]|nr:hypothetical protein [Actinomycetota bacterium]
MGRKGALTLAALAVATVAGAGVSHGTFASFTASTRNGGATFALTSLYAPGSLTATPAGHSVDVAWSAGQNGNGYRVLSAAAPNPLVNDCTGASFSQIASPPGTSYTDSASTPQGTWRCYTVQTSYGSWTSVENNPVAGARLGFVASVASFTNTGNPRIDDGDTFTITFNQPVATATGPQAGNSICWQNDRIVLGSTQSGNCAATDAAPRLGFLTGGTIDRNMRLAATWSWSSDARVLTITVGARLAGSGNYSQNGTWTFTPTPNQALLQSATGGLHVCDTNAGGGNCLPDVSGL